MTSFFQWISSKESYPLAKSLRDKGHIKSDKVEAAFRCVPRSAFLPAELEKKALEDSPIKQGIYHHSAPHMYAMVMETLDIQPGQSFLNIGSGTGYLNVLVGYMIGDGGINHGIEVNSQLVEFAREKTSTFLNNNSISVGKPTFFAGNFFRLDVNERQYDRVYCGAECSEEQLRDFIVKTIEVGGLAVVPCSKRLLKIRRTTAVKFSQETITGVSYLSLVPLSEEDKKLPLLHFPGGSKQLAKKLVEKGNIKSKEIEIAFAEVSRAAFVPTELKEKAFNDSPIKQGIFHLSAPHMYAIVLEALNIQPGNSFLNIGSGTGYFSVLAGCLIGEKGVNHGIERITELMEFAEENIKKLDKQLPGLTYCKPSFIAGNCFRLNTASRQYDRIYCGAACTEEQLNGFVVKLVKRGGMAVVPCADKLLKVTVGQTGGLKQEVICGVSYVALVTLPKEERNMPFLEFPYDKLEVVTLDIENLRIELLEERNRRKALEELQNDILDGSQDLAQEKEDLEEELEQLRSDLSDEKEMREAGERTQEQLRTELSSEREMREAAEHLQQQLRNERDNSQNVVRQKEEEIRRLQSQLTAVQDRNRRNNGSETQSWELSRDDINLTDRELGKGGWAAVKEAKFRGCPVAVKQMHELILSPYNLRLFQREMSIASQCRHPCLLQFIGATTDEKPLIVTELLDTSLRTLLQQRALQEKEALEIALDVARALNYLHLNSPPIIHRDVSSANVLLWQRGSSYRAKVSDYGTANFMMACSTINPGAAVYSAPEAGSSSSQSPKLDVYSYGVLLCEILIREFPSPQERAQQVSMVTDDDYAELIRACLGQEPTERPEMNEVIEVLRRKADERGFGEV